ncbi:hypothetical protein [Gordonia sp. MP11Mi]|uniref:Uncharacterized protein n=1 Tax=Gordonia sp. MP11Mi TaxID=3022769 RepID=A0AA97GVQ4_9ACTN
MSAPQQIEINMSSGASEIVRLVATVLFFGGVGVLAWTIADTGYAELAGTGVTVMLAQVVRQLWAKGVLTTPDASGEETFGETKALAARIADEYRMWMGKGGPLQIVLVAFAYAVAFLVVRAGVVSALTVFQNLYVAGACGALIGAFIVAPGFWRAYTDPLKKRGVINPDALKQAAPAPVPQPAPAPTPAPAKKVVRRVIKKENDDV